MKIVIIVVMIINNHHHHNNNSDNINNVLVCLCVIDLQPLTWLHSRRTRQIAQPRRQGLTRQGREAL